jgi:hypothetical protein
VGKSSGQAQIFPKWIINLGEILFNDPIVHLTKTWWHPLQLTETPTRFNSRYNKNKKKIQFPDEIRCNEFTEFECKYEVA